MVALKVHVPSGNQIVKVDERVDVFQRMEELVERAQRQDPLEPMYIHICASFKKRTAWHDEYKDITKYGYQNYMRSIEKEKNRWILGKMSTGILHFETHKRTHPVFGDTTELEFVLGGPGGYLERCAEITKKHRRIIESSIEYATHALYGAILYAEKKQSLDLAHGAIERITTSYRCRLASYPWQKQVDTPRDGSYTHYGMHIMIDGDVRDVLRTKTTMMPHVDKHLKEYNGKIHVSDCYKESPLQFYMRGDEPPVFVPMEPMPLDQTIEPH